MKKIIALVLSMIMILCCIVMVTSAESSDETYEVLDDGALIFGGSYNENENRIEIQGNINYDILVTHSDCRIEVYKLLPYQDIDDIIFGNDELLVASMDIAVKFSFSFEVKSSVDRFCRYFVVFCSPDGERIVASQPKYLSVESDYVYSDNGNKFLKGIYDNKENTSVYSDVGVGTVIVPVYYDKLLNGMSNGYLFPHENDYCYFDKEYIDGLSATIRSYSASGARVYLQLLMPTENSLNYDGNVKYVMPNMYSSETISLTCTYVRYLSSKFDKYTEGKISGFIVGDSIDIRNCNYSDELDLKEYAKKYAYYLMVVANAARCENPKLDIVVPISGYNSFSEECQLSEGDFSSSKLIETISSLLSQDCTDPLKFSLLVDTNKTVLNTKTDESGSTVYVPNTDNAESIGVDNVSVLTKYITDLNKKYKSAPDNIIYKWSVPNDLGGNRLSAAYAYIYYSLFAESKVSAFVTSFENAQGGAFDTVKNLMLNIDTDKGVEKCADLLPLFGVKGWKEIIDKYSNKGLVIKTRNDSNSFQPNQSSFVGSFSYVSFALGNIRDFYGGSFSKVIKTDYGVNGHRVLKQNVVKPEGALHTDLFCLFEYKENYVYTPTLKIDVGISDSTDGSGALYEVKAVIGNGSASVERTCIVKSGDIYSIWLDMSEFNGSNLADYIRISTRSITGTENEYSLLLYDVCGYSTEKNSEELKTLISEERARIREQYDTENIVSKDSSLYKIVFIILIIAILAIGVLFVFLRRDDYDKN